MPAKLNEPVKILVLVTPSFNLAATVGFIDPFRALNYLEGRALFKWTVASTGGGTCLASNGLSIETEALKGVQENPFDFVILSSSWTPEVHNSKALESALRHWARSGSTVGSLDTGAFILAEAGLLKGKKATVHYEHIDAFKELYPDTETSEDMFVLDGNRLTCCGGAASADFALQIIRGIAGDVLANDAARYIFQQSMRQAGTPQNPGGAEPLGRTIPVSIKRAIKIMEENLEDPIPIPEICSKIGVSQRQFDRLFSRHVSRTPAIYYRDIRLDRARGLVTQTEMPMSEIAIASGFASQVHFSRAYRERFGLPPSKDRIEGRVPFEFRAWPMHRPTNRDT